MSDDSANTNTTTHDAEFSLPTRLFHDCRSDATTSPPQRIVLKCVDCHAAGEPARVVLGGCAELLKSIGDQNRNDDGPDGSQLMKSLPSTAYEKRQYMMKNLDFVRRLLIEEPRGYPCQNVNFVFTEKQKSGSKDDDDDDDTDKTTIQYVIGEQNNVWPMMSGHNTLCVATALIECGVITLRTTRFGLNNDSLSSTGVVRFDLEAPGGIVHIEAKCRIIEPDMKWLGNVSVKAESITITNQPAFVEVLDLIVDVPFVGQVKCDIAWGSGMWYCVVDINQSVFHSSLSVSGDDKEDSNRNESKDDLKIDPSCAKTLCRIGERIKVACREQHPVQHPTLDYEGVDILVYIEQPKKQVREEREEEEEEGEAKSDTAQGTAWVARNTVVMSNTKLIWDEPDTHTAMLDRSPCGTGTCAVMAVHHARGLMNVGDTLIHKSILGTTFRGKILKETLIDDGSRSESSQGEGSTEKKKPKRTGIIPSVEGSAYITQYSQVVVDPDDPFPQGYSLGDIW